MKKIITFGEIMMRLSAPGFTRFVQADQFNVLYAGSEANVAVSLAYLGLTAEHITRFPDNDFGQAAVQALQRYGVGVGNVLFGDDRIGVYFLENGSMQRSSRIIFDRFNSAFANIKPGMVDWDEIMKDASWFHWTGITPAISQGASDVCREAIQSARKNGVVVSGDINYRRNLWQYGKSAREVMPALIESTDVIVAGITDMENCAGIGADSFEESSTLFMKTFPNVKKITTTNRQSLSSSHNKIAAVLWTGKELLQSKQYDLTHIVDRVGTGDAFMAGLVYGWIKKWNDQQTLEFGTAACALKHTITGDVNLVTAEEIERLVNGENIGKLLR